MSVSIRHSTPDDRPSLEACFRELQAYERSIEPNRAEPDTISKHYIDELLESCEKHCGAVLVAEADGSVIGFVCVLARVPSDDIIEREREYAYVTDLVVLESHRQAGVATDLMKAAEAHATENGATRSRVGALASNKAAYALYRKMCYCENEIVLEKRCGEEGRGDAAKG